MTENLEELPISSIEKSSSEPIDVTEKEMLKQFMDKQEKINKELIENQQKILEKLQSNEDEKNRKRGREDCGNPIENFAKTVDSKNSKEEVSRESQSKSFEQTGKWFVLKHTFKNVSKLDEGVNVYSEEHEHFGMTWKMTIRRDKEHLVFFTWCASEDAKGVWSIEAERETKLWTKDGKPEIRRSCYVYKQTKMEEIRNFYGWGYQNFKKWEDLDQKYLIDNSLTFEVSFKIKSTTGIYKDNMRCFDDTECSDIVLVVQNKKFHVSKLYLAAHSPYFKAMLLGMFGDAKKSEIPLSGIDADDFQNYLEVLYAEPAVDEYTVEGILMVADMYDTEIAIRKCEEFLLEKSKKTLKKKLELSVRYRLENLKKQCLSEIKTSNDIRAVLPPNICDLDHSLMADLLQKSLANS